MEKAETVFQEDDLKTMSAVLSASVMGFTVEDMDMDKRQRLFRLMVRLDKRAGKHEGFGPFETLPYWMRQILHRTFAPVVVPKPKVRPKPVPKAVRQLRQAAAKPKPMPDRGGVDDVPVRTAE